MLYINIGQTVGVVMGGACTTAAASGPGAQSFYELSALDVDGIMFNFADLKGKVC